LKLKYHLAILKKGPLDAILSGKKVVESRFTRTRRVPFGQISREDKIFLKLSSSAVCGRCVVDGIEQFEDLSPQKINKLKSKYNHLILGDEQYWQSKRDSRYGVLVWLKDVRAIKPVLIDKNDWRAWVMLTDKNNYGLIKCWS